MPESLVSSPEGITRGVADLMLGNGIVLPPESAVFHWQRRARERLPELKSRLALPRGRTPARISPQAGLLPSC